MTITLPTLEDLDPAARRCYTRAIQCMREARVPFLVGGAYAWGHYTGIIRHTKDFDVFLKPEDCPSALAALADAGFHTETTYSHWLGKAFRGEDFIDLIFSSGNGICKVDDLWFEHAPEASLLGETVKLCPAEEIIWSKAFICERERFDGADIAHLLRARGGKLDWERLLWRFGDHWPVLLSHLILFGYAYPSDREAIPARVLRELTDRVHQAPADPNQSPVCRGTLLSRIQYIPDLQCWGYADARLAPEPTMSAEEAATWTEAGVREQKGGNGQPKKDDCVKGATRPRRRKKKAVLGE